MAPLTERVALADGEAIQGLIPGVSPIAPTARALADLERSRAQRRGAASLPSGGLFDETAIAQQELF